MSQVQESRPGGEPKAAVDLEDNYSVSVDQHASAVLALNGVHVVVVTTRGGRSRRHTYWTLAGAQVAVDRATMAGNCASIVLCQLVPVGGAL